MPAFRIKNLLLSAAIFAALLLSSCEGQVQTDAEHSAQPLNTTYISQALELLGEDWRSDWRFRLVNAEYPLSGDYLPETSSLPNGLLVDSRIYADLTDMLSAGAAEGLEFAVCSAYRSYEFQQELFDNQVQTQLLGGLSMAEAYTAAKTVVAEPGTSEHNLGLSADIVALSYQLLDEGQADTAETKWLHENAWNYGFVVRYPDGKQDITGIIFEPWHYRYVGREAAEYMVANGLCLEELWAELENEEKALLAYGR